MRLFVPSKQVSAKNQASHTKLKFRCGSRAALVQCLMLCCARLLQCWHLLLSVHHDSCVRGCRVHVTECQASCLQTDSIRGLFAWAHAGKKARQLHMSWSSRTSRCVSRQLQ